MPRWRHRAGSNPRSSRNPPDHECSADGRSKVLSGLLLSRGCAAHQPKQHVVPGEIPSRGRRSEILAERRGCLRPASLLPEIAGCN
eukprot:scaffold1535_cov382-Prasinococcus_capsulatus_cf.AAC.25